MVSGSFEEASEAEFPGPISSTPVFQLNCKGFISRQKSVQLHQVAAFGGIGMPFGLIVNGKCVTCKNSNGRCVHRSQFSKSTGVDDAGKFLPVIILNLCREISVPVQLCAAILYSEWCRFGLLKDMFLLGFDGYFEEDEDRALDGIHDDPMLRKYYGKQSQEIFEKTFERLVNKERTGLKLQ